VAVRSSARALRRQFVDERAAAVARASDAHLRGVVTRQATASRAMPCGWPPPLPAVRDLHLVTEVQSFLKRQRVGGHDGACGVRPVGPVPRLARATSCTRPTPPTISPPMAVMMLTQSATASPFEVFVRPTAGRRRGSRRRPR
jgi:hypothetical protein